MNDLILSNHNYALDRPARIGEAANQAAARYTFADYRSRKAKNTLIRQDNDLSLFAQYLAEFGIETGELSTTSEAWNVITWGLVEGFVKWQLGQGFAVSSINVRLSTVKTYAKLAVKAGMLDKAEYALIKIVSGYSHKESNRINETRQRAGVNTRLGYKKVDPVSISKEQAILLKTQPDTAQGRRDTLLMCLLLDHGLRCGEVARLQVTDFDLQTGELRFYRPKVDKTQTHRLTADTLKAARAYLVQDAPKEGCLWLTSNRSGNLIKSGMSERAITKRVKTLGEVLDIKGLSAHDCRHYWATQAVRNGTQIDRLQDAGGWNSPSMPLRYVEAAKIANEGINLGN